MQIRFVTVCSSRSILWPPQIVRLRTRGAYPYPQRCGSCALILAFVYTALDQLETTVSRPCWSELVLQHGALLTARKNACAAILKMISEARQESSIAHYIEVLFILVSADTKFLNR